MKARTSAGMLLGAWILGMAAVSSATPQGAGSVSWNDNGVVHEYRIYADPGTDWDSASNWVSATLGGSWHLATITTAAEQAFFESAIIANSPGELWLGGFQDPVTTTDPAANWKWVTNEPWSYTNWGTGEPNDARCCGGWMEQHLAIGGAWNDEGFLPNIYGFVAEMTQACIQPPSGMIAWWPGDGTATDVIGGNDGTLFGGATFAGGNDGQAFSFAAPGDMAQVAHNSDLNLESLAGSTFEGWFKSSGGSWYGDALIIGKHTCGVSAGWFFTTGQGCFIGDQWVGGYGVEGLNLDDGRFHHFACIKDGTVYREYIDGSLISQSAGPSAGTPVSEPVQIGSINTGICDPAKHQLFGLADELTIFTRALSSSEVKAIYLAGSAGTCKNHPPVAGAGPDRTVEQTSCAGANVTLDGAGSSDSDGNALTYSWTWPGGSATGVNPTVVLPYGTTTVTLTVDDGNGGTATETVNVNVVDTTPPVPAVSMNPNVLWPPNHKYVTVQPSIAVRDVCVETTVVELLSATSNEPDNGLGDGDTANDIAINSDGTVSLRAERSGKGSGRVYTIIWRATDQAGNSSTASAAVTVPHDMGKK